MDENEAVSKIYQGQLINCTEDEYRQIRNAILDYAGLRIDYGDHLRAKIALSEVARLDKLYPEDLKG